MPGRGSMNLPINSLLNPAKKFTYQAPQNVDDTYVVFIIGETTRWDHMGIFGYERNTTPKLAQEKIWRRSVVTPVILQPNSHCVACLYVRVEQKIIRSAH